MQRNLAELDKAIIRLITTYLDHRSAARLSGMSRSIHNALTDNSDNGAVFTPAFKLANCLAKRSKITVAEDMLKKADEATRIALLTTVVQVSDIPSRVLNMSALYFVACWAKDTVTRKMIMKYVTPAQIKPYLEAEVSAAASTSKQSVSFSTKRICSTLEKFNANTDSALTEELFQDIIEALGTLPANYKSELARQDLALVKDNGEIRKFDSTTLPVAQVTTDGTTLNPYKNPAFGKDYAFVRARGRSVKVTKADAVKYSTETYADKTGPKLFSIFAQAIQKLDAVRSKEATEFVTQVCEKSSPTLA